MITQEIKDICLHVWACVNEWIKYNPDIDQETMQGACCIASYALYRLLKRVGYSPTLVIAMDGTEGHSWLELDGSVYDLTCKQFSKKLPDILVINKTKYKIKVPKVKRFKVIFTDRKAIAEYKRWAYPQSPDMYLNKINYMVRKVGKEKGLAQ